jgi:hypothetical protein
MTLYFRLERSSDLNHIILKVMSDNRVFSTFLTGGLIQDFYFALEDNNIEIDSIFPNFLSLVITNFFGELKTLILLPDRSENKENIYNKQHKSIKENKRKNVFEYCGFILYTNEQINNTIKMYKTFYNQIFNFRY